MNGGLKLGTRGSPLALAQARKVAAALETAQRWPAGYVEVVAIKTSGDKILDRPLAEAGGKALWTKELDQALLEGNVDFCVHSMKDVESDRPLEIHLAAVRPRGDVRDRLIGALSIAELPQGAKVGTSSPRRAAQLRRMRPDIEIVPLRGNVETRLQKVEAGEVDATLLAAAGLKRLGLASTGVPIPVETLLPAPGQGALGLECRTDDNMTQSVLTTVNNQITYWAIQSERAFLRALNGSCHSPVAALALLDDGELHMRAQLFSEDGSDMVEDKAVFDCGDDDAPRKLALRMLGNAPASIRSLFAGA
jgi:hydroxymethylbilane synthase